MSHHDGATRTHPIDLPRRAWLGATLLSVLAIVVPTAGIEGCQRSAPASARLVGVSGAVAGQTFPLASAGTTTIGREPGRDIVIATDDTVSRRHAYVRVEGVAFVLYDDNSTNGTFVNGTRITRQPLAAGNTITLGQQTLRFDR